VKDYNALVGIMKEILAEFGALQVLAALFVSVLVSGVSFIAAWKAPDIIRAIKWDGKSQEKD
jgi:hypothetical protein